MVKKIAALYNNLCVVGDDAQSIYAFRGANIQNILNFKNDYPDYKLFKLEQNYRSTNVIVQAANGVIANNSDQIQKNVWTANSEGDKIEVHKALTEGEEAFHVANTILDGKYNHQAEPRDFAILYRTNAQSRALEEALRKRSVPYRIYGGLSFYQRKEVKDLLAYLRLICNPADEESFKRVINFPARGIGKTTIDKLIVSAGTHDVTLWDVIKMPNTHGFEGNAGTINKLGSFGTMIESFQVRLEKMSAYEMAEEVAKSTGVLRELHKDKTPEGVSRYENIQELLNGILEFTQRYSAENEGAIAYLPDFLIEVALLTDADETDEEENNRVALMTIHSAKGLEFPYVHIVGLEENLFPSQMSLNSKTDLEEERRLFYVALTRAEKKLNLSFATSRFKWGNIVSAEPSRFLEEIGAEFMNSPVIQEQQTRSSKNEFAVNKSLNKGNVAPKAPVLPRNLKKVSEIRTAPANSGGDDGFEIQTNLLPGSQIMHPKFGKGKVLQVEGEVNNQKATVFFPAQGQKQLLLRFAKLKVIAPQ
ncbi:MAG: DNA helicase-2/ATP-dependent DNA helicase PcrA [Sphingobacteriales bacterium]